MKIKFCHKRNWSKDIWMNHFRVED